MEHSKNGENKNYRLNFYTHEPVKNNFFKLSCTIFNSIARCAFKNQFSISKKRSNSNTISVYDLT